MAKHNEFGSLGEQKAVDFLRNGGYAILARNYRYLNAEVDIIAQKEDTLAIVEVKSRTMGFLGDVSNMVSAKKVKLLMLAANHFVEERDLDVDVRFDVITIIRNGNKYEIEHLERAFYHF
ncbi:YraN family protein [Flagellimonas meishanensis]|uniref:YraN family protein n=1 Tax=Flagellimonas meishanensis TaxID=2873264 RepID=UPI001CA703C3|nr:YraN family protein [[Muricauda] meishanensis]